jgi:hypothetical protein
MTCLCLAYHNTSTILVPATLLMLTGIIHRHVILKLCWPFSTSQDTIGKTKLATYKWRFAIPKVEADGQTEPAFPPKMPRCIGRTAGIPFAFVKQLM